MTENLLIFGVILWAGLANGGDELRSAGKGVVGWLRL